MPLNSQHDYGPNSQQPDVPPAELRLLCSEFYQREVVVTPVEAQQIEADTQGQAEAKLWYHHRRLRVTSSNFGKIAKRRATTPVAAQVKCLLYGKNLETKAIRWGRSHEDEARKAYVQYLAENGHPDATVSKAGLVINVDEPCLASSPDGFVNIPGTDEPLGIVEFKCPYSLARDFVTPQDTAASMRSFCYKIGGYGNVKLKTKHDYHFQVQGALAIMKRPWCDFVVWTHSIVCTKNPGRYTALERHQGKTGRVLHDGTSSGARTSTPHLRPEHKRAVPRWRRLGRPADCTINYKLDCVCVYRL